MRREHTGPVIRDMARGDDGAALASKRAEIEARVAAAKAAQLVTDVGMLELSKCDDGRTAWIFRDGPPAGRMPAGAPYPRRWWMLDKAQDLIANELEDSNFCIIDGFLGVSGMRSLRAEVTALHTDGKLQLAKLAGGRTATTDPGGSLSYSHAAVRGDHVGWFTGNEGKSTWPKKTLSAYQQKVDALVAQLALRNNQLASVSTRTMAMVACYPGGGARYVRHCDNSCAAGQGEVIVAPAARLPL